MKSARAPPGRPRELHTRWQKEIGLRGNGRRQGNQVAIAIMKHNFKCGGNTKVIPDRAQKFINGGASVNGEGLFGPSMVNVPLFGV